MDDNIEKLFKKMTHLKNLNDILFKKIQKNLKQMNFKSQKANEYIENKEIEKTQELLEEYRVLVDENNDYLIQQVSIVDEMDELKTRILIDNPEKTLKITVNGEIPFDDTHPFYKTEFFVEMLLEHYRSTEEYERCAEIKKHLEVIKRLS